MPANPLQPEQAARRRWMAVLARAGVAELEAAWHTLAAPPAFQWLRKPETGLAMLRGRAGGSGVKFNLGEASLTRCALRSLDAPGGGNTGVAYVLGRSHRHAELAAQFDALLQDAAWRASIQRGVIARLAAAQEARRDAASRKAAATRVDFYTLVRGENP
jgi:alpha-D-ribose 1-methylphosphonate 5-triphosphate synthase subunit PhnG